MNQGSVLNTVGGVLLKERVFGPEEDNQEVYSGIIEKHWGCLTKGINMCVFTYGQTFSGKTHTMKGIDRDPGIVARTLEGIFSKLGQQNKCCFEVSMSYFEIYNESIYDLLDPNSVPSALDIRLNKDHVAHIKDLVKSEIPTLLSAQQHYEKGEIKRKFAITNMNHNSSRSHVMVQLDIRTRFQSQPMKTYTSTLIMADLAGSECIEKSKTYGQGQRESSLINKSLLALSSTILKLNKNEGFISYRDSKLTRILQPVLTDNCVTAIICTVNPERNHLQESLNTLRFGICAGGIRTVIKPSVQEKKIANSTVKKNDNEDYEDLVERFKMVSQELVDTRHLLNETEVNLNYERSESLVKDQTISYLESEVSLKDSEISSLKSDILILDRILKDQEKEIEHDLSLKFDRILYEQKQAYEIETSILKSQLLELVRQPNSKLSIDTIYKVQLKEMEEKNVELEKQMKKKMNQIYTLQDDNRNLRRELAQANDFHNFRARKLPQEFGTPSRSAQKAKHSLSTFNHRSCLIEVGPQSASNNKQLRFFENNPNKLLEIPGIDQPADIVVTTPSKQHDQYVQQPNSKIKMIQEEETK